MVVAGAMALCFAAGAAGGYLTNGESKSGEAKKDAAAKSKDAQDDARSPRVPLRGLGKGPAGGTSPSGNNAFRGASIANAGDTNARMRACLERILNADESEYAQLMIDALREFEGGSPFLNHLLPIIAERWVEADPAGAFQELYSGRLTHSFIPDDDPFSGSGEWPHPTFELVLERALALDPEAVRESVLEKPGQPNAIVAVQMIARIDAHKGVMAAFEFIDLLDDADLRDEAIGGILDPSAHDYRPLSVDETCFLIQHYPDFARNSYLFEKAFHSLAKQDHESALALAEEFPPGTRRVEAVAQVIRQWASKDFEGAMAYVESVPSASEQGRFYTSLFRQHAKRDPAETANTVLNLPSRKVRNSLLPEAAKEWFTKDPAPALEWMDESLNPGEWKKAAENILKSRAGAQEKAVLATRFPPDNDAVLSFLRSWNRKDPDAVSNWIATRPPGDRPVLLEGLNENDDPFGS